MAGAEEIFFIEEKTRVLDELIQVSKYSKLKKTISAQPDHEITNIRPSHLEQFYSKNLATVSLKVVSRKRRRKCTLKSYGRFTNS